MSSGKLVAVVGIVGVVAALGQLPAHAALNLNTGEGALTYAKETLTATVAPGSPYYRLNSGNTERLSLEARVGRAVAAGDTIFVQFSLTDMVFGGGTAPTLAVAGKAGATATLERGGAVEDAAVSFNLTAGAEEPLAADDMMRLTVTSLGVLAHRVGAASVGTAAGAGSPVESSTVTPPVAAHTVVTGLRETAAPASPVVRLGDGFRSFAGNLRASVGRIFAGPPEGARVFGAATSSPVTLGRMISPTASTVTFRGDVSFTSDVFLSNTADCASKDEEGILVGSGADRTWTAVNLATANNRHLCLEVDGETSIPETLAYEADIRYRGVSGAAFPPANVAGLRLGKVVRAGTTVHIPVIQTHPSAIFKVMIANRRSEPVSYRFDFIPPTSTPPTVAVPGPMATGTIQGNSLLVLIATTGEGLVTVSGPRGAISAILTLDAPPEVVGVLTKEVNRTVGSTDTITYTTQ